MMKKLLSIATLLLVSVPAVLAQSFEFRYHGESLADGATVTIQAEEDEWGFGEICCETNPGSNPYDGLILKLLLGDRADATATLTVESKTFEASIITWCMGETCVQIGDNTTYVKNFTVKNGSDPVRLDAQDITSEGHFLATLNATINGETRSVKIKFIHGEQVLPVLGDVNGDGNVTAADVTLLYNIMLNNDYTGVVNADQNGDGNVTAGDVTTIYNILLVN